MAKQNPPNMKRFLPFLLLLAACGKPATPPPPDTKLRVTLTDLTTAQAASGATVYLYTSATAWYAQSGYIATTTADGTGTATFSGLSNQVYYWYAVSGCRDNWFQLSSTNQPIISGITTNINAGIAGVGMLKLVNNSDYQFKVYVNGVIIFTNMNPHTQYSLKEGTGQYDVHIVQVSGGGSIDRIYTGALTCGGILVTTWQ